MFQVEEDKDSACYAKARAQGQPTFCLIAQDFSSPETICFWIMKNILTCPAPKLREALEDALKMREWPTRKNAD